MNPEELLAHADFVRGLSRLLVFDEHTADDVAQQAYVAALEQPPGTLRSPRGWLATVTRNLKNRWYRTESRRTVREQSVSASEEGIPSTGDVVQREETRRHVVDAVLSLEEPHRSAVLLKFYEDLSTGEVAKRLNIKYETARGRIRRGLEKLRTKLDAEYGGDRDAWCLALLPMAGLKLSTILNTVLTNIDATPGTPKASASTTSATTTASTATVTGTSLTSLLTGVLRMSTKAKLFALLIFSIITSAGFWILMPEASKSTDLASPVSSQMETAVIEGDMSESEDVVAAVANESKASASDVEVLAAKEKLPTSSMFIAGRVTDASTGEPVTDFHIGCTMIFDSGGNYSVIQERIQDEEGRFHCPLRNSGRLSLFINSCRHRKYAHDEIVIQKDKGVSGLNLKLDRGGTVRGRVVDDETGLPVADAVIGTVDGTPSTRLEPIVLYRADDQATIIHSYNFTSTDDEGRFLLSGLDTPRQKIMAAHHDYALGFVHALPNDRAEHEIRLPKGLRVFGKTFDDHGTLTGNVLVSLRGADGWLSRPVVSDSEGKYKTAPALPGRVFLRASRHRNMTGQFSAENREALLVNRDVEVDFGPSEETTTWRGKLLDYENRPIADAVISLDPYIESKQHNGRPLSHCNVRTDEDGFFEARKLCEPIYDVTIRLPRELGRGRVAVGEIRLGGSPVWKYDLQLTGGMIEGTVIDGNTGLPLETTGGILSLQKQNDFTNNSGHCSVERQGKFTFHNIDEGSYWIFFNDRFRPAAPVDRITVDRGEIIRDLDLVIPETGRLDLSLEDLHPNQLHVNIQHEDGYSRQITLQEMRKKDAYEIFYILKTGDWQIFMTHEKLGMLNRQFSLRKGEETAVLISRSVFNRLPNSRGDGCVVNGRLLSQDNTPVQGAGLTFRNISYNTGSRDFLRSCVTDGEGRFCVDNMIPGDWSCSSAPMRVRACILLHYPLPGMLSAPSLLTSPSPVGGSRGSSSTNQQGF